MSSNPTPAESKIEIHLDPEVMKGVFSNVTNIGHTKEEFLLDFLFIQQHPAPFGKLVSRIISTPGHAKRLMLALQENIRKYEEQYGIIDTQVSSTQGRTLQ
ncbi:MAG: DUF3467 domain-containing protein [Leptospiraceae bacterium]|nr:DUF3467 domain-containing protein [Leptospiraceae bacterium]MCB1201302.1 DUF3467 domain-containing protein [Leptospiraceae bacterium]